MGERNDLQTFEELRKDRIDARLTRDQEYWRSFDIELKRAKVENTRVLSFLTQRLQADVAYADALAKLRPMLESPEDTDLSVPSSSERALARIGQSQQDLAEKLQQFSTTIKRDVMQKQLEDMIATYESKANALQADGASLQKQLETNQRNVLDAFDRYTRLQSEDATSDTWLAQLDYCVHVTRLQDARVEYVKGMAGLFQQYKTLETWRSAVLQTALDTYLRKQKLLFEEMAAATSEPIASVQRMHPERDLLQSVRRIPKNRTAEAVADEEAEAELFRKLQSPLASERVVRCGFLKFQDASASTFFRTWVDALCVITRDGFLHCLPLKEGTTRSISTSWKSILLALDNSRACAANVTSLRLPMCRLDMHGSASTPTFDVTETRSTNTFTLFRSGYSRKVSFQCSSQDEMVEWAVAAESVATSTKEKEKE